MRQEAKPAPKKKKRVIEEDDEDDMDDDEEDDYDDEDEEEEEVKPKKKKAKVSSSEARPRRESSSKKVCFVLGRITAEKKCCRGWLMRWLHELSRLCVVAKFKQMHHSKSSVEGLYSVCLSLI